MILSFKDQNKCNGGTNAMQNTLLSRHKLVSFAFQVKWYEYDTSHDVILSAPPSFIPALIVKNSILNNFAYSARNSDPAPRLNIIILIY